MIGCSFTRGFLLAHLRRDATDCWASTKSGDRREALDRVGKLYELSAISVGQPATPYAAVKVQPAEVEAFFTWSEQQLLGIHGKSNWPRPSAMASNRGKPSACSWKTAANNLDIGHSTIIQLNAPADDWKSEGKNCCCRADTGARKTIAAMTIIKPPKLNGLNPTGLVSLTPHRIHDHKIRPLKRTAAVNWVPMLRKKQSKLHKRGINGSVTIIGVY